MNNILLSRVRDAFLDGTPSGAVLLIFGFGLFIHVLSSDRLEDLSEESHFSRAVVVGTLFELLELSREE